MQHLTHELSSFMSVEKKNLSSFDGISTKIVIFSFIVLVSITVISLFEVLYVKQYLQKRKLI
jgi:hypothetical protein